MKFGLVRRGYSASGGAEAYLQRFAAGLVTAGHEPLLYSGEAWPAEAWPHAQRVVAGGRSPLAFARALAEPESRRACDFLFSLERVLACDCYRAGDGVHAAWLERRARAGFWLKPLLRRWQSKHRELLALERSLFQAGQARQVIANSAMVRDEIVAHYGYPRERIQVVYNGVPPAPDAEVSLRLRAEVRHELGLHENDYVLLFAGTGWDRKGLRAAIRAMNEAALARPLLLVAGRGRPRSMPPSSRVRYLGAVPGLTRWLAASDAFILPTLYDPFSNACLEAFAAGLPVITTTANGFAEILAPEEGTVIADPHDLEPLVQAIEHWASPERRTVARERLRSRAALYSIERNVRETLAAFAIHA